MGWTKGRNHSQYGKGLTKRFETRLTPAMHALFEACRAYEGDATIAGWLRRAALARARELSRGGKIDPKFLGEVMREGNE